MADAKNVASKASSGLGMVWKAAKYTVTAGAVLSLVSLTGPGGSVALAGASSGGFGSMAAIPIEGLGEAAEKISEGVSWATTQLQAGTEIAANSAVNLNP